MTGEHWVTDENGEPVFEPDLHRPVLWETMVFGGPLDQNQVRYDSRQAAINGHAWMIAAVRAEAEIWRKR